LIALEERSQLALKNVLGEMIRFSPKERQTSIKDLVEFMDKHASVSRDIHDPAPYIPGPGDSIPTPCDFGNA
jgi:hypothetical protein